MTIQLRKVEEKDLKMIMTWRMLPEVTKYMYTDPQLSMDSQLQWFEKINRNYEEEKYWIIQLESGQDVGLISVNNIDYKNKTANWAYYLAEIEARGKGLAKILECNLYDYIFFELKINKIWYEVLEFNEMVIRLHEKFGGKIEGKFIDHIYKNGEFHNVIRMATFKKDWKKLRERINYTKILFS
ncbi:UDP-4-amino-4,6-dideoxy-N-acetyl-beta-L-altrosamine N-acetyltransferase [Sporosarcina obsidiansis]|uniref:UDP-4-amino-4, 6-dideoxy-N-acetyl-beta-L-altrosamine N-acetyltransferase n=1 Tax=Sporosarcina obsidiansis TaxID=2660748 RepID=UPI00129B4DA6|nr:UDP-4-amino-4,6-dideoxy-N-acetyl-beta-L-altrosamine N-acetyltransferase [Sporosarcina obsidiansis]